MAKRKRGTKRTTEEQKRSGAGKTIAKVIAILLFLAFVAGVAYFIYMHTNGFNEGFKTFYIQYDGEKIFQSNKKLRLVAGRVNTFEVHYTFDFGEAARDYNVDIVPASVKFDYEVGDDLYPWSGQKNLAKIFKLEKKGMSFTLDLENIHFLSDVFERLYPDAEVIAPTEDELGTGYLYTLIISSYNGNMTYNFDFMLYIPVDDVVVPGGGIVF